MTLTTDPSADPRSDAELADATRSGDAAAFAVLWQRHFEAGLRAARAVTRSIDPDDLVSEAFTKTFSAMQNGGGPTDGFRAYLYAAIRNAAATWGGKQKDIPIEFIEEIPDETPDAIEQLSDRTMLAAAFKNLPENHRTLLWYLEVEGMKPREIAPLMGLTPNAVSALALRARDGFRHAWLDVLIADPSRPEECRWACGRLVRRGRRPLSRHERPRLDSHLAGCAGCTIIARDIDTASSKLRAVLLPLALGTAGAAAYASLEPGAAASATVIGPSAVLRTRRVLTLGIAAGSAVALAATVAVAMVAPWSAPTADPDRGDSSGAVARPVAPSAGATPAPTDDTAATPPTSPPVVPAPVVPAPVVPAPVEQQVEQVAEAAQPRSATPAVLPPQSPIATAPPATKPPIEAPPAFTVGPDSWDMSSPLAVSVSGTGIPGSAVAVIDELGWTLAEGVVDDDGGFELSVSGDRLRQGMTLTVQHTAPAGDVDLSEPAGPLVFPVPVISGDEPRLHLDSGDADADGEHDDALVTLEGIPGGWVQVAVDGVVLTHLISIDEVTSDDFIPDIPLGFHLLTLRYIDVESGLTGPGAEYAVVVTPGGR
ncbi:sigma-70 family RNA polymerase sigma factor [Microbacterium sp. NPDC089320]|uniref:sigma-70 family RNA polymerase sigma factor n=1 Tax=Microbacterium sp. NPDC089320 TaxID=3155182 RepID=UPI003413F638